MKWLLISVAVVVVLGVIAFIAMALQSHSEPENLGLQRGQLRPCPATPNCVCSESHAQDSKQHAIKAVTLAERSWQEMREAIVSAGGEIQQEDVVYLHATFTTPVFRYVDDVELRLDETGGLIHIRSASRVGRSDFGVNRKRVTQLTQ